MADVENSSIFNINERRRSILVLALFSSWMLALPFQGRILYEISDHFHYDPYELVFLAVASQLTGLIFWGFLLKTKKIAKRFMLFAFAFCFISSFVFFYPPSVFWVISLAASPFVISAGVVGWSYYFRSSTPRKERIKTAADGLILTNIFMILLNAIAVNLESQAGLGCSMLFLIGAFIFSLKLPESEEGTFLSKSQTESSLNIVKPLAYLCLFIVLLTINSGFMYQVINPAFSHLESLTSWYWAVPYVLALYVVRNLPQKVNRNNILYLAIAMMGLSFVAFMMLNRSSLSYFIINTLLLGACGVYDLFWWSILGEMLDMNKNPALIFGAGLSANVLGVLLGGIIGMVITSSGVSVSNIPAFALVVVFISLVFLPIIHKHLSLLLKNHAFFSMLSEMPHSKQKNEISMRIEELDSLSEREKQVVFLLLHGKTYRIIAKELYISENTVKYHVRNIYSKFNIQSRSELIDLIVKEAGEY